MRDHYLAIESKDVDIVTNASVDEIISIFNCYEIDDRNKKMGNINICFQNDWVQITCARIEFDYQKYRYPKTVLFTKNILEDLKRRDFTMNGLIMDEEGTIFDYVGGMKDIDHQKIVSIEEPDFKLQQDALRILRAYRFKSNYHFSFDEKLSQSLEKYFYLIDYLTNSTVQKELSKFQWDKSIVSELLELSNKHQCLFLMTYLQKKIKEL